MNGRLTIRTCNNTHATRAHMHNYKVAYLGDFTLLSTTPYRIPGWLLQEPRRTSAAHRQPRRDEEKKKKKKSRKNKLGNRKNPFYPRARSK
ncbi:hypothetical protein PUN28_008094 [Cardiocondyla obscurior]|uniref:Uncharacterized protein n=1 Tax=Cardiocondyla obscurior TaxID=286306 RepID=A0AAW2FW47_9HYME